MPGSEFLDLVKTLRLHEVTFRIVPAQLKRFCCGVQLDWELVRFKQANAGAVPDRRGVYAFVVEKSGIGLPPHGFVMYVGKAGDGESSLRRRFRDYFQEKKRLKRPQIHRLLTLWAQVLCFYFAEISDTGVRLPDVEVALNDALLPPFCKNDFSANIRTAINAF